MSLPTRLHGDSQLLSDIAEQVIQLSSTDDLKILTKELREISRRKKSRKQLLDDIRRSYQNGHLVLVLGAGVSKSQGLPDWNTLLQKLILTTISAQDEKNKKRKQPALMAKVIANVFSPNPLISARYLSLFYKKLKSEDPLAFTKAIQEAMYEEADLSDFSELIKEIRSFCIAAGKSPNLDCVITYNYDDLVESSIDALRLRLPFRSIYKTGINARDNELAIYHVHGYIPRESKLKEENEVTLSDDSYHNQYNDVYSWSNLIQINKFKDANCLFIGVSFTDPNLRRLLDIAKAQRGDEKLHHFSFRLAYSEEYVKSAIESIIKQDQKSYDKWSPTTLEEMTKSLIEIIQDYETRDAESFGVGVVWVNNYDEIPVILNSVRILKD